MNDSTTAVTTFSAAAVATNSTRRFTEELREAAGEQWNRVIHHKFTQELAAGTIDKQHILKRYLVQDFRFLDAFVQLLASIITHARCLSDRIPACQFLALVTSAENTYFERCFERLGMDELERSKIPNAACTAGFCNLMREVAFGGNLAEMLAVICVCEWSYLSWANQVQNITVRDDFMTYEWVDLHSGPDFENVVEYFRELLDKEGQILQEEGNTKALETCRQRFLQAVQLEEDFFDYAYSSEA